MSSHLQWMVLRNNSAFLLKGGHGQTLSSEPNNLKGKNSFRFNGLVHSKTVGVNVRNESDGARLVLTTRKQSASHKPANNVNTVEFKVSAGPRRVLNRIRSTISKTRYRKDLKLAALRRASALMGGARQPRAAAAGAAAAGAAAPAEKKAAKSQ